MLSKITSWRHSKILAFVLAVAVFLTAFYGLVPAISLAEATEPAQQATKDIWDGNKPSFADAFGEQTTAGKGASAETPYEITTGAQLYAAVHSAADGTGKYFVLMNDIQLQSDENLNLLRQFISESKTGTSVIDPTTLGLNNWSTSDALTSFQGNLDGNFHTVTGLYNRSGVNGAWGNGVGFIDRLMGTCSVNNIIFDGAYIRGLTYTGVIAGVAYGSKADVTISGCTVKNSKVENSDGTHVEGYDSAGGLIGGSINSGTKILFENIVAVNTQVTTNGPDDRRGGIFGNCWGTKAVLRNVICVGDYIASNFDFLSTSYTSSNYYATSAGALGSTIILTDAHKGGAAYETMGFIPSKGWIVEDENSYPIYVGVEKAKNSDYEAPIWNGNKTLTLSDLVGDGSQGTPYLISTGSELYVAVHSSADSAEKHFLLMNDIQLQSDEKLGELRQYISGKLDSCPTGLNEWTSSGSTDFRGNLDGNFHTVTGLYKYASITATYNQAVGFIDALRGTTSVKNITLDGAYISSTGKVGGIAGQIYGSGSTTTLLGCIVKNSKIESRTSSESSYSGGDAGAGGLIGSAHNFKVPSYFENCVVVDTKVLAASAGTAYRGGFFGSLWIAESGGYVIKNSICIGDCIAGKDYRASVASSNYYSTAENDVTGATLLTETHMGGTAYDVMKMTPAKGWIVKDNESYPMYVGTQEALKSDYVTPIWNGNKTLTLSDLVGDGSQGTPYLVSTGSELYGALQNTEEGKQFQILNDIYLGTDEISNDWNLWEKNKLFAGTLNGNGYTIYNMEEVSSEGLENSNAGVVSQGYIGAIGLIPGAQNATVNNLHIRNAKMGKIWCRYAAAIVGIAKSGTVSINGCSVDDSVISGRTGISAFVGRIAENTIVNIENCVAGAENEFLANLSTESDVCTMAGFVGINQGTVNLDDSISIGKPLVALEEEGSVATPTNVLVIADGGDYADVADFKEALISGEASVSNVFYYDYLSANAPQLKNRLATQDKDIDGNEGAVLDDADVSALKNILLYGSKAQLTLSEGNTNGYNSLAGVDITDLVYLSK